jgi:hypothetical protein
MKPAICQASSSVRSRLVRARQNWRVRPIRLSLAACVICILSVPVAGIAVLLQRGNSSFRIVNL